MAKDNKGSDDGVGYKRPPRHAQFKPGQSGNPQGRPKGNVSLADMIVKHLRRPVRVTVEGSARKIPMIEAIILALMSEAMKVACHRSAR